MAWLRACRRHDFGNSQGARGAALHAAATARALRRLGRVARRVIALVAAPVLMVPALPPVAVVAAVAGGLTAASVVVTKTPARASTGSVLILSTSVNGGSSSAEALAVPSGYSVTVASPSAWDSMTTSQFASYSAIVIGDPSGSTCATGVPSDALSTAATWGPAVTGNVAVVGTAPVFAGASGEPLLQDAIGYAVAGSGTGLYVSLNCEDATAAAGTGVPLLAYVDGGGFTVTGQGSSCPDSGTVNTLERVALPAFNGLTTGQLASWSSPACSVEETMNAWPAALAGVAYDASAMPADFTASDGAQGQAYVVAGAPPGAATAALAPSVNGEVSAAAVTGGSNPAAPGVTSSTATAGDPVNVSTGDLTQSATDLSIPTFGPPLDFTRTYDAQAARQQTVTGTPGPMGYGWTDNWSTSLATHSPAPGDIYTIDGLATDTNEGGPATSVPMSQPERVYVYGGDTYIADTLDNRIIEVPGTSKTQFGIVMTAGHAYTIAGSPTGASGSSGDGTPASSSLLDQPRGVAIDSNGDLIIADTGNCRVVEVAATTHSQWGGISMTAGDMYVIAGRDASNCSPGYSPKLATSSNLDSPEDVSMTSGDLFIADTGANRIQMVAGSGGESGWGISSTTAGYVYTVAGNTSGTSGNSGDGGKAASAELDLPGDVKATGGGLYIADTFNCQVREVAKSNGTQFGISMTADDIYTLAGRTDANCSLGNDNKSATSSDLSYPAGVDTGNGGQLYIADTQNKRIQEVAATAHSEWGQSMTVGYVYTIAGSASGTGGYSGNGGAATSALLENPSGVTLDSSNDLVIADTFNNEIRTVSSTTYDISDLAGGVGSMFQDGNGGPAVTAGLNSPYGITTDSHGDIFVADTFGNRVQEIAAYDHTQFGIAMTAADVYTVAGMQGGYQGDSGDGGPATSAELAQPTSVAVDSSGDLFIADSFNQRIQEVSAATGDISTFAGSATGQSGNSGQGGPATSALLDYPYAVAVDASGDVFIAGNLSNQVQEVPAASGNGMTAGDIYTIAGSTAGTSGHSGDGGPATSALLDAPQGIAVDAAGNVYIADYASNQIQEIAASTHTQWGQAMTAGDIYTIAGSTTGTSGNTGDGGPATSALLAGPGQIALDSSGNLYITDAGNNRIREIAAANGTQWAQSMTAGYIYNVAGSATRVSGNTGDGGPATAALLNAPLGIAADPAGDLFITDSLSNNLREVTATSTSVVGLSPQPNAITITQPGGAQVSYYPQSGGSCASPYVVAGGYCTLPQNVDTTLSYNSTDFTYVFSPSPGTTYTYAAAGALNAITDAAGDALTVTDLSPAPGSGECPLSAATCDTITSASGRSLVLGFSSGGLLTSATDPMGRQWTYGYNSADDLVSVTDPLGNVTTYTYGAGSTGNPQLANDLLTITSPNAQPGGPDAGDATVNVYDSSGRVTSQTDPMGFQTTFDYSGFNTSTGDGVVRVSDPDGNTTVYDYSQGALAAQADWTGGTLTSEQDYGPNLTAGGSAGGTLLDNWTANGNASITSYTYDAAGNTVTTTDPLGNQTSQWSTALGLPACSGTAEAASSCSASQTGPAPLTPGGVITPPSSAPPKGVTYTQYDTNGNVLWTDTGVYQPGASSSSYQRVSYDLYAGNSVTLGGNNITCSAPPPSASLPCATINPDGVVTQLGYNISGDLTSSSTPDGNGSELATTTYGYDADGEQTSMTAPDGNLAGANAANYTTATAYNSDGQKTSVTQAGGIGATVTARATSYHYDANGNQTQLTDARGYTTTTSYNADNQPTLVTTPTGNATLTCYDGDGHTAQTIPPAGVAASSLTPASCPTSYPAGYTDRLAADASTSTYDAAGNQTQMTSPAPAGQSGYETTTYTYDGAGQLTRTTAPPATNGGPYQVTVDVYDANGRMLSQTTGYGTSAAATISYCYDPNGDRTAVVYPDGNTSGVAACQNSSPWAISSSTYPVQASYQTTSSYDSAGELVSTTAPATAAAPNGATTTSAYDPAGNMLTRTDPNGVTTTWTYTPLNQPKSVSYSGSSAHSVTYTYDASGNKTGMTDATGSSSYLYDPFNELTSTTNGSGQATSYGYNRDGEVSAITYPLPASATWAASDQISYGYGHDDTLTSVTDFNNNTITISHTPDGLPSTVTLATTGDNITTNYDNTDMPSSIALQNGSTTRQSFTYSDSPAGTILSEADTPSSPQSPAVYTYDAKGRVTSMTPGSGTKLNYGFDASSNLTTTPTGATGSYDNAGELTSTTLSGTTTTYTYNADGQRLGAMQGSTPVASGTWNGAGQLTAYTSSAASMSTATYDGNGLRASSATTPAGGSATSQGYVWNTTAAIPQLIMDSANAYIYDGGLAPAEQVNLSTGTITYLVTDLLGSVRGTVNSSGTLTGTTSYDAWGNPETAGGLTTTTPFGYAGGYTDPTGLIYLINRYYDPSAGQFISLDPMVKETFQPYDYASGNPVDLSDPSGLWWRLVSTQRYYSAWYLTFGSGHGWISNLGYYLDQFLSLGTLEKAWVQFELIYSYYNWVGSVHGHIGAWRHMLVMYYRARDRLLLATPIINAWHWTVTTGWMYDGWSAHYYYH